MTLHPESIMRVGSANSFKMSASVCHPSARMKTVAGIFRRLFNRT